MIHLLHKRSKTPETTNAAVLVATMAATFAVLRVSLSISPDADLNVCGYNIHHLFTGLVLATVGGIPLALFGRDSRGRRVALTLFGAGLAMALDEWVYLITTDGTNSSYLLPVSLWGGVVVVGFAAVYAILLAVFAVWRLKRTGRHI